jgi:agmatine deiminase
VDDNTREKDPRQAGYRMPAEWETHEATWLVWPHNSATWSTCLRNVRSTWAELIAALASVERVCVLVNDAEAESQVVALLRDRDADLRQVRFYRIPTVDVWIRDYGPTFVVRSAASASLALVDWEFNAWGGKYADYVADNSVGARMNEFLGLSSFRPGIVLEGGSIEVNGAGTLLTTEQCLLNANRNAELSRKAIEDLLKASLSVDRIIWLNSGVTGDDTDGHIDNLARFVDATTIVCVLEEDPGDENYGNLRENYERLVRAAGEALTVVALPQPDPLIHAGIRLPASYANFYIANETVLVPLFQCPKDRIAMGIFRDLFPKRRVVGIDAVFLVRGLGGIHCVTQQQPMAGACELAG